jgi:Fe-S cluster biogenesis protein NfuA
MPSTAPTPHAADRTGLLDSPAGRPGDHVGDRAAVKERVRTVINLIRPAVQADGGDIELVDVTDAGVVQIRFHGACHGCPSSTMTLHMGIERNLREKVPEITQVVSVA